MYMAVGAEFNWCACFSELTPYNVGTCQAAEQLSISGYDSLK